MFHGWYRHNSKNIPTATAKWRKKWINICLFQRFIYSFMHLSPSRRWLVLHSAHNLQLELSAFARVGSYRYNLHNLISFENPRVIDLHLISQFCDLRNVALRHISNLPLSTLIYIVNKRYSGLPTYKHLPSQCRFEAPAWIAGQTFLAKCAVF